METDEAWPDEVAEDDGAVVEPETDGRGEFVTGTPARSHGLGGESIFLL